MNCPKCYQPAIQKRIISFKKSSPFVEYTHAPNTVIGQFALVETCLVIYPTKDDLHNTQENLNE